MRLSEQQRLAAETPEEREARLRQLRLSEQQRLAAETPEEREARLRQLRLSEQQRLAAETPEEREARLRQLRLSEQQRLAAETPEEREARLQQLRTCQQQRIASETPQETEARRRRDRECHTQHSHHLSMSQPLLHQPAVRSKMSKFQSGMADLQVSTCVTCMERFPGMTVRTTFVGTECLRCSRDKHSPKTYSSENNVNPATVPPELLVSQPLLDTHLCG